MNVRVNGEQREMPDGSTLLDVLAPADRDVGAAGAAGPRRGIAVALDGAVVPRAQVASVRLAEGARIEIVTAVQGG